MLDYYENNEVWLLLEHLEDYNRQALKLLKNNEMDAFVDLLHEFMKLHLNQCPAYHQARFARHFLDKRYVINYFKSYDVTLYIDELTITRSKEYEDSEFYYIQDEINGDMKDRLDRIQACFNGEKSIYTAEYDDYMKLLNKLHSFQYDNTLGAVDNAKNFRSLVNKLATQKRKCMPVYVLPDNDMHRDTLARLRKTDNYEEALDITMELVNQIKMPSPGRDNKHWIDNTIEGDNLYTSGNKEKVDFFNTAMIDMGIEKSQYKAYTEFKDKDRLSHPSKKLVLGMALYLEMPLPQRRNVTELKSNIEKFMNMHSYSLSSPFTTLSDVDELLDDDILFLIEAGLDIKVISYFMRYFARSRQFIRAKNGGIKS